MGKILQLLLVLVIVYFGVTWGIPYIRDRVEGITPDKVSGRPDPSADERGYCIHLAHQANGFVVRELRLASGVKGDPAAWTESVEAIEPQLRDAENACSCPGRACELAGQAIEQTRLLVDDFDRVVRGDTRYSFNLANRQEQIDTLLEQARATNR